MHISVIVKDAQIEVSQLPGKLILDDIVPRLKCRASELIAI